MRSLHCVLENGADLLCKLAPEGTTVFSSPTEESKRKKEEKGGGQNAIFDIVWFDM